MSPNPRQQGFAIMAAIFIIVVLAALAAFVVSIGSAHLASLALDIQGSRALQVARSGMDWGVARVVSNPATFGTAGDCRSGARSATLGTGAGADFKGYSGFTVTVECRATLFQDGGELYSYAIIATACNEPLAGACPNTAAPSGDYIERSLSTQIVCNASGPC